MLARVLAKRGLSAEVTIGTDPQTAGAIEQMGVDGIESLACLGQDFKCRPEPIDRARPVAMGQRQQSCNNKVRRD